jgi:hypothetical protein
MFQIGNIYLTQSQHLCVGSICELVLKHTDKNFDLCYKRASICFNSDGYRELLPLFKIVADDYRFDDASSHWLVETFFALKQTSISTLASHNQQIKLRFHRGLGLNMGSARYRNHIAWFTDGHSQCDEPRWKHLTPLKCHIPSCNVLHELHIPRWQSDL